MTDFIGHSITCSWQNDVTLTWDIVDYDEKLGEITLLLHDTLPNTMVFEPQQALAYFENGLASGAYSFMHNNKRYYFQLTADIPAGGQLLATTETFDSFGSNESTTAIESGTVSETEITGATDLGTTNSDTGTYPLNHMDRVLYGSNNLKESALYYWLNSEDDANVRVPRTNKFARPYSYTIPGFKRGLDADFLAHIAETDWKCNTNNVYEAPTSMGGTIAKTTAYTVTSQFCFASRREIFNSYDGTDAGDKVFDLFDGAQDADCIKYYNNTARTWWLRSPSAGHAYVERHVHTSGAVNGNYARSAHGVVPACKIKKSA
jgi:hypothetical protein